MARPLTPAEVAERFDYVDGELIWKKRPTEQFSREKDAGTWNTRYAGKIAGLIGGRGYRHIRIGGKNYRAHRLIWLLLKGEEPDQIDHIDGNRVNNRIENLRSVPGIENSRNLAMPRNNTSGHIGICFDGRRGKWEAHIKVDMRKRHLGYFDEKDDAIAARRSAQTKYGFHPNHGRAA